MKGPTMSQPPDWFTGFFGGLYGQVLAHTFSHKQTLRHATIIRKLLHVRRGARVLDIPCGQGRITLPLAQMGLSMTGVDFMAKYLRRARAAARQEGADIRYLRSDMRRIEFDGEFHAAFCWFSSFGYFSDSDNLEVIRRVFKALRPGGRFLIEGLNRPWYIRHLHDRVDEMRAGVRIVHRSQWDPRTQRARDEWRLSRRGKIEKHAVAMRMFDGAAIRKLLREGGFATVRLYAYPSCKRLTAGAPCFMAVGTRE
jgi:ubiquinone/menaquinone biosynthesis C-methylase UbiE